MFLLGHAEPLAWRIEGEAAVVSLPVTISGSPLLTLACTLSDNSRLRQLTFSQVVSPSRQVPLRTNRGVHARRNAA